MAGGGGGRGVHDDRLDDLWRSCYGGDRLPSAVPAPPAPARPAARFGPLGVCAIPDRPPARLPGNTGGPAPGRGSVAVDDDPQNGSVYEVPATGSAVDLDGYLLAGRGGWARMLRDRDQLRAVASGPQLQVVAGGGLVRVWQPHRAHRVRYVIDPETGEAAICPQAVKRGAVVGMSFKAQRRMRDLLHSLRSDGPAPLWVTLTLPGAAPGPDRVRVMFNTWVKRVSRKYPGYAGVWRIAPQQRGAAHLHLMMWGVVADGDRLQAVRAWMAAAWHAIAGGGDAHHLQHGCTVKRVSHVAGIRRYIGKYQSRTDGDLPGRSWGVMHRDLLPVGRVLAMAVPAGVAADLVRYVRRACYVNRRIGPAWVKRKPRLAADHGATRYGDPGTWLHAVHHLSGRAVARGSWTVMMQRAAAALAIGAPVPIGNGCSVPPKTATKRPDDPRRDAVNALPYAVPVSRNAAGSLRELPKNSVETVVRRRVPVVA